MVSSQGPLPSPITELDLTAEKYGKECATYLMMTPDGEMMCRDKTGKIVATTAEDLLLPGNKVSLIVSTLDMPFCLIKVGLLSITDCNEMFWINWTQRKTRI